MEKILKTYIENRRRVQIFIRDKTYERVIESLQDKVAHLVGEKYEYHLLIDQILSIGVKLNKEKRTSIVNKSDRVGFK